MGRLQAALLQSVLEDLPSAWWWFVVSSGIDVVDRGGRARGCVRVKCEELGCLACEISRGKGIILLRSQPSAT